jgi:hypothetical protein
MAILLLLHVPPAVTSVKLVVEPTQTEVAPVIADGDGFTVTIFILWQPPVAAV